ncbi:hypothetical protein [Neptunicella marina]|uniref:Uncharacterized protein n=1 Tax=Neptunicella marina TaxID=2125989 RepID=A0A8J6M336_9ALTE|nr:hypothetical protein [Neptunicella marina]MBC3767093.1 hypothetical protein [Neptunicella marina]
MPVKKWITQYSIAWPLLVVLLGGIQYLKGRSTEYSIEFGLIWASVSLAIFAYVRVKNFRRGTDCALCNDLPARDNKQ